MTSSGLGGCDGVTQSCLESAAFKGVLADGVMAALSASALGER